VFLITSHRRLSNSANRQVLTPFTILPLFADKYNTKTYIRVEIVERTSFERRDIERCSEAAVQVRAGQFMKLKED
jgi:hypothetical protein